MRRIKFEPEAVNDGYDGYVCWKACQKMYEEHKYGTTVRNL